MSDCDDDDNAERSSTAAAADSSLLPYSSLLSSDADKDYYESSSSCHDASMNSPRKESEDNDGEEILDEREDSILQTSSGMQVSAGLLSQCRPEPTFFFMAKQPFPQKRSIARENSAQKLYCKRIG
jgi:hypothetical protein